VQDGGGGGGGSGGGGVWGDGGAPLIEDCRFEHNQASFGAGVYFILFCSGTVRRCEFSDGQANEAGGLYTLNSDALVEDCLFERNSARAGTFSVGGGVSTYFSSPTLRRCTFVDNLAELGGGGTYCEGEAPSILECTFVGNRALGTTEGWGGGLMVSFFCQALVQSSVFLGNEANRGGGLYTLAFGEPEIVNCTLVDNRAVLAGGPLSNNELSQAHIANCVTWRNQPALMEGLPLEVRYACIEGGYDGIGNQQGDPLFVATPDPGPDGRYGTSDDVLGDLRLAAGSPCIDAGDNGALRAGTSVDRAGHARFRDDPRVLDRGIPAAPVVDQGAYEH
jgi:hypothetical protein